MENIGFFLSFCDEIGVPKSDIFQTVDLYENQNIPGVSGDFCWRTECVISLPLDWPKLKEVIDKNQKGSVHASFSIVC